MIAADVAVLPVWVVVLLGLAAPAVTFAGYFLTRRKVQEIHVLVNSQLAAVVKERDTAVAELERRDTEES